MCSPDTVLLRSFPDTVTENENLYYILRPYVLNSGAWGGVVVKALRYSSDGPGIDSRWFHWIFQ
jgi:hypothetical protein